MVGVEAQCAGLPLVCSDEVTDEVTNRGGSPSCH